MGLKKWINKLKPLKVDRLVYYFPQGSQVNTPPIIQGVPLTEKGYEYVLEKEGKQIHRSRVFPKSHLLKSFNYQAPFVVIGDCETDPDYRGKGIYPQVIRYLGEKFSQTAQVYILVDPDNIPSIAGIEKAGFVFMARLKGLRLLFFYLNKSISIQKA